MTPDIGWELVRSFLGVLQEGSLSGAARALGVAQPTIGRHVAALEAALKLPLFTRSPTGLLPTEAALALRPQAEAMASSAAALQRLAASQGAGVQGTVRITASEVVGVEVLPPMLAALRAQHPALQFELVLSNRMADLLRREADIAVRMTPPRQEQLIARRIGAIALGLHAAPDWVATHGRPRSLAALKDHALVGFDRPTPFLREAAARLKGLDTAAFALRSDSDLAQLALIRAGAGIGMCQVPLARRYGLVRLLPRQIALPLDTWVTMHEDLRASAACRATFDALATGLAAYIG